MGFISWLLGENEEVKQHYLPLVRSPEIDALARELVREPHKYEDLEQTNIHLDNIFPSNFKQYIGQEKAKRLLERYVAGIKKRNLSFPHCLISGDAGKGKTTLARIIGRMLGKKYYETIASNVKDPTELLMKNKGGIVFIDEIHSFSREQVEGMYQMMEDFTAEGESIAPFTLIGATTEVGEMIEDRLPFYERFKIVVNLEDYTYRELLKLIYIHKNKLFKTERLPHGTIPQIALNCRGNPRRAVKLLESTVYFDGDVREVFKSYRILWQGFTETDKKVLEYLTMAPTVGMQSVASYLGTSQQNYLYDVEPYLLKTGMILRLPRGRQISLLGKRLLHTLRRIK